MTTHPVNSTTCPLCTAIGTHTATCPTVVGVRCPIGTPWCTNHNSEYGESQCVSESLDAYDPRPGQRILRDRQVSVWLTQEPGMGEPVIAVDTAAGAEISTAAARTLIEGLTALLAKVER